MHPQYTRPVTSAAAIPLLRDRIGHSAPTLGVAQTVAKSARRLPTAADRNPRDLVGSGWEPACLSAW